MIGSEAVDHAWRPDVTVAAVIEHAGRFLMVEEKTTDGLRLNQPAGHLELGESLLEAAIRETLEESAHDFVPTCLVGVYQWPRPQRDISYLRFAFGGEATEVADARNLDAGILRALWLSADELRACVAQHRSPLVMQCVEDWLAGRRFGLDLVRHYE